MYKTVFQNSKGALLFAGMVLFGAVSMVGTPEDGGLLPSLMQRFGAKPAQQAQPSTTEQGSSETPPQAEEPKNVDGWYDPPPSVFGSYSPNDAAGGTAKPGETPSGPSSSAGKASGNPMTAPLSPTAIVTN